MRRFEAFGVEAADSRLVHGLRTTLVTPLRLCLSDPFHLALSTEVRLELSEGPQHGQEQTARRGGGIELSLLEGAEANALRG